MSSHHIEILELSDPENPLTYTGTLLASNKGSNQSWSIIRTNKQGDMLFIDGQHQSSCVDEHIYHETFVHTLMQGCSDPKRVLILGGAEGCTAREVLRYPSVTEVVQVDWDESLVQYFQTDGIRWNQGAYFDARLKYTCADAIQWLQTNRQMFDVVLVDLLDPREEDMAFVKMIVNLSVQRLSPKGAWAMNIGCVKPGARTPACSVADFIQVTYGQPSFLRFAYKVHVPSYEGDWCFVALVRRTWSAIAHTYEPPYSCKWITKHALLQSMNWLGTFDSSVRDFWKLTDSERELDMVGKKLTPAADLTSEYKFEHYGC
jgi:spermidine synthase